MGKFTFRRAISPLEFIFAAFMIFIVYSFVAKQIIADIKCSDMKKSAVRTYANINQASTDMLNSSTYENKFLSEYDIIKVFSEKINPAMSCKDAKKGGCWSQTWLWDTLTKPGMKLKNGQYVVSELSSTSCKSNIPFANTCGALYIDTNGSQKPNRIGQDIIKVYITKKGLIPAGAENDIINPKDSCDFINKFSWGCTAKLLGIK